MEQGGKNIDIIPSSEKLNNKIIDYCRENNIDIHIGRVHTTDAFYSDSVDINNIVKNKKCLAAEMEAFALFYNAKLLGKNATAILTVSDNIITHKETTSEEREKYFTKMFEIALNSVL